MRKSSFQPESQCSGFNSISPQRTTIPTSPNQTRFASPVVSCSLSSLRMATQQLSTTKSRNPSFFKIMIGDFKNSIMIPVAFRNRFEAHASPTKYTIKDPSGICWDVTVNKVEEDLFFTNGWPSFAKQHSLEFGDLLVFTYVGGFTFKVKIFGKTGCEKQPLFPHGNDNEEEQCEGGDAITTLLQKMHPSVVLAKPQGTIWHKTNLRPLSHPADQDVVPRKSFRRDEISCVNDCKGLNPADMSQGCQEVEKEYDSWTVLEAFKCKTRVAVDSKINNDHEDQKTNKRSSLLMERKIDDPITVKRRKSYLENGSLVEEQICKTHLKSRLSLRKSKRLVEQEKKGKTIETSRRKEGISVHPNSERSDMAEAQVIPVHSSDSESEDTENDCNREVMNSTEKVESHRPIEEDRNKGVSVHQDGHGSPIRHGNSDLTSMLRSDNPSCRVVLTRSYMSRGFMHLSIKLVRCLTAKPTEKLNLRLHAANGKIWNVGLNCSRGKSYLLKGWAAFVKENNLKVGDGCFFELINREKLYLKVLTYHTIAASSSVCGA